MKKFRFSLEAVLGVRRRREEQLQMEFSALSRQRALGLQGLAYLENGLRELNESQAAGRPAAGGLDAAWIAQYEAGRRAFMEKLATQRRQLALLEERLEAKRLELVEASRQVKVLEKLEEGQRSSYLEQLGREEQSFLDEVAAFMAARSFAPGA